MAFSHEFLLKTTTRINKDKDRNVNTAKYVAQIFVECKKFYLF